jgi:hypothetical protein
MDDVRLETRHYDGPAGSWGSLKSIGRVFARGLSTPAVLETPARQNKTAGHISTSCARDKPADPHIFAFCENFNPGREKGLQRIDNPQNPVEMLTGHGTDLSYMYLQVRPGGDIAALMGLCKHVLCVDQQQLLDGGPGVIDRAFIADHTYGFGTFAQTVHAAEWDEIEHISGVTRAELERAADVYIAAEKTICVYGMGLSQHVHGSRSVGMLVNLMLLKGNIGRPGAGVSPVRGQVSYILPCLRRSEPDMPESGA